MELLPVFVKTAETLEPGDMVLTEDGTVIVLQIHFPDCLCDHDEIIILALGVIYGEFNYYELSPLHNLMVVGV